MSKEIIERKNGQTLWRWNDAEGRWVYCQTADRDGVAIEPSGNRYFHSQKAGREN